jgi:hypothetical protein
MGPTTTPGQTVVSIGSDGKSVRACGVTFKFHRTLRVPDTSNSNNLPPVRAISVDSQKLNKLLTQLIRIWDVFHWFPCRGMLVTYRKMLSRGVDF